MKIAVIGGAGVRTPLLVAGLQRSSLPLERVCLYDIDRERLEIVGRLAREAAAPLDVSWPASAEAAVDGADYVFTSLRVGGMAARARDEAAALAEGVVGQETVGPAGFAMALRTIGPLVACARLVQARAPQAWIINFTNPVGIVTQAVARETGVRIIGICDTPTELFEEVAHALGVPSAECFFDYVGLNHLGWLREVVHRGRPALAAILRDPARLGALYRAPLFDPAFLADLGLLPTEYLFYYYRPQDALANLRAAGWTRGRAIVELTDRFFAELADAGARRLETYWRYLEARDADYFRLESGGAAARPSPAVRELTGYDMIALAVVQAIHTNSGAILPLDVVNQGAIGDLPLDDVVEVPCVVNATGARPLATGRLPEQVRTLVMRVKDYERTTIGAALSGSRDDAVRALALNPLVPDRACAARLVDALELPGFQR